MQQLLTVMHGSGTTGILPPEKGMSGLTAFILRSIFGVSEGLSLARREGESAEAAAHIPGLVTVFFSSKPRNFRGSPNPRRFRAAQLIFLFFFLMVQLIFVEAQKTTRRS